MGRNTEPARRFGALGAVAVWVASALLPGFARAGESEVLFSDATRSAGLDFRHWNGMSGQLYYPEVVGAGAALFDYDNDGDLDLYLVQGNLLGADVDRTQATVQWKGDWPPRDRLYRNDLELRKDGTRVRFVDVTEESGIKAAGYGMGVTAGDLDNDGWTDLYVLNSATTNSGATRATGRSPTAPKPAARETRDGASPRQQPTTTATWTSTCSLSTT